MPAGSKHAIAALAEKVVISTVRRSITVSVLAALALGALPSTPAAPARVHLSSVPTASGGWLNRFNQWRASTGVSNLTEVPLWSTGDYDHALYMVKNDLVTHYETVGTPYYTTDGDTAARNSNIYVSSSTATTDEQAIDWWMQAPFHAMGMMDPRLTQTGFGSYREVKSGWDMGAAVDVLRGNTFTGGQFPVMFPGPATTEPLTSYGGGEFPDPLQACSGYTVPTGLPVFVEIGGNVATTVGPVHTITGNGVSLENCVIDSNNPSVGSDLTYRGGVILIPRQPLQNGVTYTVALTVNGLPYTWSFTVGQFITSTTPCTSAALTSDKASPQVIGTVITLTATSTGCPNPQYLFYVQSPAGVWSIARNYGGGSFAWDTSTLAATGNYVVNVWVRDAGSGVAYQANALLPFTIGAAPACTTAGLTSDKASPQLVGTTVTFTATSAGCSQPQYLFYVQAPGDIWRVAQNYGGPTFVWNSVAPVGIYKIDVWVRQAGSGAAYQAIQLVSFTLTPAAACANATLSSDKGSPQQSGTIITFTATSTGCTNPQYLFYVQLSNGTWTIARNYGGPTFVWNTAGLPAGAYHVDVWVRQLSHTASYETLMNNAYTLVTAVPCASATLTPDKASSQPAGTVVTYTATSTGCSQPVYTWYFQVPGGSWYVAQNGGTSLVWNTTGAAPGTYKIDVWVSQYGSVTPHESFALISYTIT